MPNNRLVPLLGNPGCATVNQRKVRCRGGIPVEMGWVKECCNGCEGAPDTSHDHHGPVPVWMVYYYYPDLVASYTCINIQTNFKFLIQTVGHNFQ